MAIKVSYVSDLHLEFLDFPDFSKEEGGDVLILAGDILTANLLRKGRTDQSSKKLRNYLLTKFKDLTDSYNVVLYIMGNHEHYKYNYMRSRSLIKRWFLESEFKNVITMENDFYVHDYGVTFIGSTLWTDYQKGNPFTMEAAQSAMNDYRVIFNHNDDSDHSSWHRTITPEFILNEHMHSVQYIRTVADNKKDHPIVVFTHHGPTWKSINPIRTGNALNGAYTSDLSNLILDRDNIRYWIHGHTHDNIDYEVGVCRVLSNQRGYPMEDSFRNFPGLKSFTI